MGGDPVMLKTTFLKMEEDMKALLEKASLLDFFRKFIGCLILEVSGLPLEGEVFEKSKSSLVSMSLKGNLLRVSGTPVSKDQLLLGPVSLAQNPNVVFFDDEEEEEDSPNKDADGSIGKRDDNHKRNPAPQVLASSLIKYSGHSIRLQKKTIEKVKIIDYVDTSNDEKEEKETENPTDMGISGKGLSIVLCNETLVVPLVVNL
eukprot:Gb_16270 [translate_table: standard]